MIVYDLKSITNFSNINVYFISMEFTWWSTFGDLCPWMDRGWARFPSNYFVN